ncbi:uncharacterized protein LOC131144201 [Malania oleifera]|uniref:uncharacterized protein LOC131144201 n=1 Tax=Malania oleifera TaxID=397392 RepID=UPI0025AEAB4B|nr:uncharacterized protein LOC131144201 [Malania oleifera]
MKNTILKQPGNPQRSSPQAIGGFPHLPASCISLMPLISFNVSPSYLPLFSNSQIPMDTLLRIPTFRTPPPPQSSIFLDFPSFFCVSLRQRSTKPSRIIINSLHFSGRFSHKSVRFLPFASNGEATETDQVRESDIEDNSDGAAHEEDTASDSNNNDAEGLPASVIIASLQSYKEALASNNDFKIAEIEASIKSVEDEKVDLERRVATLSEELSFEKDRILRISADFDNFRKRTERERLSLVENAQGEVVENLLPVLDNFERAKVQMKVGTEGEEKINSSYQSIYKQFVEVLDSLGVVSVETIGNPFDPLLHEAIMREESTEFEEGIVLDEYRKGFKLGDRLLRPSMVKVSAGPGPAKPEPVSPLEEAEGGSEVREQKDGSEVTEQKSTEAGA